MSNETMPSLSSSQIISETYEGTVQSYTLLSAFTILAYASCLHFADEVEYIWNAKFTLPTFLYLFSKYPALLNFSLNIIELFLPELASVPLRICNDINILGELIGLFSLIGVQGLISIRAYSLCEGYRPMGIALSIAFLTALGAQIYELTISSCGPSSGPNPFVVPNILNDTAVVLSDVLAFIAVIRNVWSLWKLKHSVGLQSNDDFLTLLLQQGIIRFCFVLFITVTQIFLTLFSPAVGGAHFIAFQNGLSSLLICEFTIDLRRRNIKKSVPNQSALDLPTLSFQENTPIQSVGSVLGRLHESIIAEMGERNVPVLVDDLGSGEADGPQDGDDPNSTDGDETQA